MLLTHSFCALLMEWLKFFSGTLNVSSLLWVFIGRIFPGVILYFFTEALRISLNLFLCSFHNLFSWQSLPLAKGVNNWWLHAEKRNVWARGSSEVKLGYCKIKVKCDPVATERDLTAIRLLFLVFLWWQTNTMVASTKCQTLSKISIY